jgi:DNA repair exonuclease SbcCD ATPase subunit
VGDRLHELETKEQELYNRRHAIGQIADQKAKFAKEQPYYPDAPKEPISASELIRQQQEILARNGENQRKRQRVSQIQAEFEQQGREVVRLTAMLNAAQEKYTQLQNDLAIAQKDALDLHDESTAELEKNIQQIDEINRKVRANLDKDKAEADANEYRVQYETLTAEINAVRQQKTDLLANANLPLPGLSVEDGELIYNGQCWDNMSGSEQLRVATAIVRRLKPNCGFILLDKLEQMDLDTLREFGEWLEQEGLQAIATRVSTGDECSIIIEDGYVAGQEGVQIQQPPGEIDPGPTWKAGEF